uniref:Uncharacterized protein n=1 Tax=Rhizophora mucronata TaxID=61149 RepID=A0A2P2KVR9_RHIMU
MRAMNERRKPSIIPKQPASSKHGRNYTITIDSSQSGRNIPGSNVGSWAKLVLDLYPQGTAIRCTA